MSKANPAKPRGAIAVRLITRIAGIDSVAVTGDFNGWSEEGIPMSRLSDHEWEADLLLAPGRYEYRLRVDGEWHDHPEAADRVPNPFGSENCVLEVS